MIIPDETPLILESLRKLVRGRQVSAVGQGVLACLPRERRAVAMATAAAPPERSGVKPGFLRTAARIPDLVPTTPSRFQLNHLGKSQWDQRGAASVYPGGRGQGAWPGAGLGGSRGAVWAAGWQGIRETVPVMRAGWC